MFGSAAPVGGEKSELEKAGGAIRSAALFVVSYRKSLDAEMRILAVDESALCR